MGSYRPHPAPSTLHGILVSMKIDFKAALNEEQLAVVEGGDGPTLVLAGAGSGKTRTIIYRVALLLERGIDPRSILLVTFTNKAAREMTERLQGLIGYQPSGLWSGTFHSVANRLLRQYAPLLGFDTNYTILDRDDSVRLLKACVKEANVSGGEKRFPSAAVIQRFIGFAANAQSNLEIAIEASNPGMLAFLSDIERIAALYEKKKRESNAMDFDDLLVRFLELLRDHPAVEEKLATQFQYILVDEYQDTNALQAHIVMRLSRIHRNLLVVGDDAQSIYSFRAANIRNILDFPKRFEQAQTFRLESNYRSSPEILELANVSIENNEQQFKKALRAMNDSHEQPTLVQVRSQREEAAYLVQEISAALNRGVAPQEIAVLFRAAYQSQALEFELMKRGIAYDYRGGMRFFERAHVKDILSVLRLFENVKDQASWLRVLGWMPGIGLVTAQKIIAQVQEKTIEEILDDVWEPKLAARALAGWREAKVMLQRVAREELITDQIRTLARSTYVDYLEHEYPNATERLEDIEQLARFAEGYQDRRGAFIEEATLQDAIGKELNQLGYEERIVLSTIHQAKGLEWEEVFVIALMDGYFPNRRALFDEQALEEERRLFYVAVTRAKKRLCLTHTMMGGADAVEVCVPSMFVQELPTHLFTSITRSRPVKTVSRGWGDAFDEPAIILTEDGERIEPKQRTTGYLS